MSKTTFQKLKAAGCRVDGLLIGASGSVIFAKTNVHGDWTEEEKAAVMAALGHAPTPELSNAELATKYTLVAQAWLDSVAREAGYDNLVAATSYASSGVLLWHKQALAFISWRDAVWQAVFAAIEAQTLPASSDAFIASLPQPSIPTN